MNSLCWVLLCLAAYTSAHTGFVQLYVNGKGQGDGVGVRMRLDPRKSTWPLHYDSPHLACNIDGENGVSRVINVNDADTVSFEFRSWMDDPSNSKGDGPIAEEHYGPCAIYAKKVNDAKTDPGIGGGWFKIWEDGYDAQSQLWCNQRLNRANGYMSVRMPQGLMGGDYLLRPEVIALHMANRGDPQFYTGCAQITLQSGGNLVPVSTVSIPGYIQRNDRGITFDVWRPPRELAAYRMPGPEVAKLVPSKSPPNRYISRPTVPKGCIMQNANWCGVEVPEFSDVNGCWSSAQNCWDQAKDCWNSAPPSGGRGCDSWAQKCRRLHSQCRMRDFSRPADRGADITPPPKSINPQIWGHSSDGQSFMLSSGSANQSSADTSVSASVFAANPPGTSITQAFVSTPSWTISSSPTPVNTALGSPPTPNDSNYSSQYLNQKSVNSKMLASNIYTSTPLAVPVSAYPASASDLGGTSPIPATYTGYSPPYALNTASPYVSSYNAGAYQASSATRRRPARVTKVIGTVTVHRTATSMRTVVQNQWVTRT